jgi:hypothetical protein
MKLVTRAETEMRPGAMVEFSSAENEPPTRILILFEAALSL